MLYGTVPRAKIIIHHLPKGTLAKTRSNAVRVVNNMMFREGPYRLFKVTYPSQITVDGTLRLIFDKAKSSQNSLSELLKSISLRLLYLRRHD